MNMTISKTSLLNQSISRLQRNNESDQICYQQQVIQVLINNLIQQCYLLQLHIRFTILIIQMKNQQQQKHQKAYIQIQPQFSTQQQQLKHLHCTLSNCCNFSKHQCPEQNIQSSSYKNYHCNIIKLVKVPMQKSNKKFQRNKNYEYQRSTLSSNNRNLNQKGNKSYKQMVIHKNNLRQIGNNLRDQNKNANSQHLISKQFHQRQQLRSQNKSIHATASTTVKKQSLKNIIFNQLGNHQNEFENISKQIIDEKKLKITEKFLRKRCKQKHSQKSRSRSRDDYYRNTLNSLKAAYMNKIQQGKIKKILPELKQIHRSSKKMSEQNEIQTQEIIDFENMKKQKSKKFSQQKRISSVNYNGRFEKLKYGQNNMQKQNPAQKIKFRMKNVVNILQ